MSQYTLGVAMGNTPATSAPSSTGYSGGGSPAVSSNPHDAPGYNPVNDPTSSLYTRTPITPSSVTPPGTNPPVPTPGATSTTGTDALTKIQAQLTTLQQQMKDATAAGYSSTDTIQKDTNGNIIPKVPAPQSTTSTAQSFLDKLMGRTPPNTADIYTADRAAAGVDNKQATVNDYTNQLLAITNKATADKLSLVGQGQGTPEAIIGGKQAEIDREAAIKALPIAALQAAAQGDLKLAQDHLDTLFKLHSEDATRQFDYQSKLLDYAYQIADKADQRAIDDAKTEAEHKFTTQQNNLNYAQTLSSAALTTGQHDIAAKLIALDPNSPTYRTDIAALGGQIKPKPTTAETATAESRSVEAQLLATQGKGTGDNYVDPNLYARLRGTSKMGANEFDQRFGYLVNPASANRLGIAKTASDTGVSLTAPQQQTLIGSGIPAAKIPTIESYISQFGLDALYANSDLTQKQKDALDGIYKP